MKNNHLALIAGLPSSITYFAAELCRDLLSRKYGRCEVIVLNDLGEATLEKVAAVEHCSVFLSEIPDAAVADTIRQSRFPILVIDQTFAEASLDFMAERDAKLLDTVRTMARARIGLNAVADIPRSAVLTPDMRDTVAALAHRIAALCDVEAAQCDAMIAERGFDQTLAAALEGYFPHDRLDSAGPAGALLRRLDSLYDTRPPPSDVLWAMPLELLLEATPPYASATETIDLAGPARCLSFGPYLYLPQGRWKAVFSFVASDTASSNTLGFDVAADGELKLEESYDLDLSGVFSIECEFDIENAYLPFEFRTYLRRGAIAGGVRLRSLLLGQVA